MSGTTKLIVYILLAVVFGWIAVKVVLHLFYMALPFIVIGAVVLFVAGLVSRKALGGSRRTLP